VDVLIIVKCLKKSFLKFAGCMDKAVIIFVMRVRFVS